MSSTTTCQVSGCNNSQFTFCPHCSLHICINCLNEHYLIMQNDYKEYLFNFQTELNMNRQQNRDEQYEISKKLSGNETILYDRFARFLSDKIDRHGKLTIKNFQPSDYLELKQNFTLLVKNHRKFNQLIQQINQLIADFQDSKETGTSEIISTSNMDDNFPLPKSESVLAIEPDNEESNSIGDLESLIEQQMSHINTTGNIGTQSINYNQVEDLSMKLNPEEIFTAKQLKRMLLPCPLTKYKFGLQKHHYQSNGIMNIPCDNSNRKKICLFTHLHHHHVLNTQSALKIVRTLILLPNHLDRVDLFSDASIDSLMGNTIISYTGLCPFIKHGVYGILPEHRIKLCNVNRQKKIILHYHLRTTHRIAHQHATRLVRAIMNNIDEKTPIIKPDENILLLRRDHLN